MPVPAAENQACENVATVMKASITPNHRTSGIARTEIRQTIANFLEQSRYQWGTTPRNAELRAEIAAEARRWDSCGNEATIDKIVECACDFIESAYGHLPRAHQKYVALYTACILYVDDLGGERLAPVQQFAARLTRGAPQLTPALDALAALLRDAHEMWPPIGADAIVSGTVDAVTGMYIEYTTKEMDISPHATWWPTYLRTRTGINAPFIHFIFTKDFRPTPESYLQMLPYMEHYIGCCNDVLSFYKEELVGETKNYIHNRAQAEGLSAVEVHRRLAQEVLDSAHTIELMAAGDPELNAVWTEYLEKFIEFHVNAKRYKLVELLSSQDQEA